MNICFKGDKVPFEGVMVPDEDIEGFGYRDVHMHASLCEQYIA